MNVIYATKVNLFMIVLVTENEAKMMTDRFEF